MTSYVFWGEVQTMSSLKQTELISALAVKGY